jgi:hypothetical protein
MGHPSVLEELSPISLGVARIWPIRDADGMPELPDIPLECAGATRSGAAARTRADCQSVLLRSAAPPVSSLDGRVLRELRRVGKRIAFGVEEICGSSCT